MLFEKNILQLLHKKYLHPQPEAQNFIKTLEGGWFQISMKKIEMKDCQQS